MSINNPPLIFLITRPLTTSPSLWVSTTCSQPLMRSALRLESMIRPSVSSTSSMRTSTLSPTLISAPSKWFFGTSPSAL